MGENLLPDRLAFLAELKRGGELCFDNARLLFEEARLLRQNGAIARAVCLHQLSNEECGKMELLVGWAMRIFVGDEVDSKQMAKALRSHEAKNHANAYFSRVTEDEQAARERGNWREVREMFCQRQAELHGLFNTRKNASLYVEFENGKFSAPKDLITEAFADDIAELNDRLLSLSAHKLRLLGALDPDDWGSQLAAMRLVARLKQLLQEQPEDPEAALHTAMKELVDEVLGDLTTKNPSDE